MARMDILDPETSKASILINGSPSGYVRYQRGLRQGDPLSSLLFVLVADVLCTMFDNALNSQILIGVPLGEYGRICNLHYTDDLLVMTVGRRGAEDLRVIKLILLVFEGLSDLETNFSKMCLYTTNLHQLPHVSEAKMVNYDVGLLPVTYLELWLGRTSVVQRSKEGGVYWSYRPSIWPCWGNGDGRGCVSVQIKFGAELLFWKDRWLNGLALMFIWPEDFSASSMPHGMVRELALLLDRPLFANDPGVAQLLTNLNAASRSDRDVKVWGLMANRSFSVKSFYYLLNEGGLRCPLANTF
ncbi:uncharacterized protein LOC120260128 [Dioscorea cayenensis subsp. rotundata]|uniref:Uncharacterized protein LOC120260128 n=1 Tax=Dioscorea cayennensis subsp. rotundata TaxID=55577 RepID=A0AB40B8J2_DIOCR|nr:uncharacterized protein LOC120260128 [Dioscorea cayenensis subsp. rotundata]